MIERRIKIRNFERIVALLPFLSYFFSLSTFLISLYFSLLFYHFFSSPFFSLSIPISLSSSCFSFLIFITCLFLLAAFILLLFHFVCFYCPFISSTIFSSHQVLNSEVTHNTSQVIINKKIKCSPHT